MNEVTIVFPHQLFEQHPALSIGRPVYLIEEELFFRQYKFHKQKLVLHRASMKCYEEWLSHKYQVNYIESIQEESNIITLIEALNKQGIDCIYYVDTVDNWLEQRITKAAKTSGVNLIKYPTPNFLNTMPAVEEFFSGRTTYFQTDFYKWQRKQRNILLDDHQKPLGGKWSFDADNRKKLPRGEVIPTIRFPEENKEVSEAKKYIEQYFAGNYGNVDKFHYPVNFQQARQWLDQFFEQRFTKFGDYEDAIKQNEHYLFHSVLTPMLNIGLLRPRDIISNAIDAAIQYEVPLNSLEGFIRQIMGWREFIRIVYEREGSRQRTTNYWGFHRRIPESFWHGTTGIHPVDLVIKKVLGTGYCHHIERLMVLGNFMLLCEFDPDDVYRWFMELFIDSYDWVMVPNVYGMTQFADGGLMTTKPYISGSNYLLKMGDWTKSPKSNNENWEAIWDALFWRFMHVHREFFMQNPRLGMLVNTFDKMNEIKRKQHLRTAEKFLRSLEH